MQILASCRLKDTKPQWSFGHFTTAFEVICPYSLLCTVTLGLKMCFENATGLKVQSEKEIVKANTDDPSYKSTNSVYLDFKKNNNPTIPFKIQM